MRLVFPKALVPERRRGDVESRRHVSRRAVVQRLEEYVEKAENGANVLARGADGERLTNGVPSPMD